MFFRGILHRLFSTSSLMTSKILIIDISQVTFCVTKFSFRAVVEKHISVQPVS